MNGCDLSYAITETVAGALNKISSKMALSAISEEMMQRTDESLDVDRRMPATTSTEHWVAVNSRHVQQPQGTLGRREWIDGWMVRRVSTYSRIWVGDEHPLRWISEVSLRGMTVPDHAGTETLEHTTGILYECSVKGGVLIMDQFWELLFKTLTLTLTLSHCLRK